jgi:putative ABC transport system permease protein
MRTRALVYFYRRRLRVHAMQEMLAGVGVAIAVALVFAVTVANSSVASTAREVVRAVIGPANLQLHARGPDGFLGEPLLGRVERLAGVEHAAPLLEETATVRTAAGRHATVQLAGTNVSLALMDGLAETLPIGALSPGGIGLSKASASELRLSPSATRDHAKVTLDLRGRAYGLTVSAVLGHEVAGALAQARIAVMPLIRLQQLAGLPGRVTRILVESRPGDEAKVRRELVALAAGRIDVAPADNDVSLLKEALRPSSQASDLFAGLSALLGFLFAFNAILLTVPGRRAAIADLRLDGTSRAAIVQMVIFQALCLGVGASLVGLVLGKALSAGLFHQSPGYLTKAFTLGTSTVIGPFPVVVALTGGILASCLASSILLLDLRGRRPLDAALSDGATGDPPAVLASGRLVAVIAGLILLTGLLFVLVPSAAIIACVALALATMLAVPLVLALVLRVAELVASSYERLTTLSLALSSMKATALRSVALAATGAVALFGSVALGSARDDLLRGIDAYTAHYAQSVDIWLVNPEDNQAIDDFSTQDDSQRVAHIAGVASVHAFQGSFLDLGSRRVWIIAWPAGVKPELLDGQIIAGSPTATVARLGEGGSITVSQQIAAEHHLAVGDILPIPTPTGEKPFRIAATTTNFGWTPGAILMSASDYQHDWTSSAPSALGVDLTANTNPTVARDAIARALGPSSGLEILTTRAREAAIDTSASEGLGQLGEISALLTIAAILALAAALGSSIWQRRRALAELRLEGASHHRLQLVLLLESALMLGAGCVTGAVAGIFGQVVIDGYLKHVTGFPVAGVTTGQRPIEIFVLVIVAVLALASVPGWFASRVPARLALEGSP